MKVVKLSIITIMLVGVMPAFGQTTMNTLPFDRVYQGPIKLPDFAARDRAFTVYRTRITDAMKTGPDFAGHYAMIQIGCGTSCRIVMIGDVANGRVYEFPYGGEAYYQLSISYEAKSQYVNATWFQGELCLSDSLEWNGIRFISTNLRVHNEEAICIAH